MDKKRNRNPSYLEKTAASGLEIAIGGLVIKYSLSDSLALLRDAGYQLDSTFESISDALQGGPEGMRSALRLDEALELVATAAKGNNYAAETLQKYVSARTDFAKNLLQIYADNKTFARVCNRVNVQLKGSMKNLLDFGTEIKSGWWKENIDMPVVISYGKMLRKFGDQDYVNLTDDQIVARALESSQKLSEFYTNAQVFYEMREINENTISQFCDYLSRIEQTAIKQNEDIERLFPDVIETLRQGYTVEDSLFVWDRQGVSMTSQDLVSADSTVGEFKESTEYLRGSVGSEIPLKDYMTRNTLIDLGTNPFVLVALGVIFYKGFMHTMPLGFVDNFITKGLTTPFRVVGKGIRRMYNRKNTEAEDKTRRQD